MISGHTVKEVGDDVVLILQLDFSFEFGSFNKNNSNSILQNIKDYIKTINIKERYNKIILTVAGAVVATIISNSEGNLEIFSNDKNIINDNYQIIEKIESESNESTFAVENNNNRQNINEDYNTLKKDNNYIVENNEINNKLDESAKKEDNISNNINKEEIKKETLTEKDNFPQENINYVTIYRSSGKVESVELEEYVIGVVAAEMPASFEKEAIKAQAVVARTYALQKINSGGKLTDTVSTQAYIDVKEMQIKWGNNFSKYYNKIKECVNATKNEYITYNGKYIYAVYHSTSNGYTEDASNVWKESYPYLRSVESPWDKSSSSYERTVIKEYSQLLQLVGLNTENLWEMKIISKDLNGRVETIQVGNKIYSGLDFRNLLGLRSTDFNIEQNNDEIIITTRGYGHGVGMSQYGANGMAKSGYNYKQIIKHYYTGVEIENR